MGIGKLMCAVVDVEDLDVAEAFWSEVTGLPVIPSWFPGRCSYVGQADPWRHQLILHKVSRHKGAEANRCHVDIWVRDIDTAIGQVEAIGGRVKKAPSIYPRPGSFPGEAPRIDWAVMQDPFGNEFCLISVLSADESQAVAALGVAEDHQLRVAAGRTRQPKE